MGDSLATTLPKEIVEILKAQVGSDGLMWRKAALAVGEVFTFYDRLPAELGASETFQNAVGPVTNDLSRLIEKAVLSTVMCQVSEVYVCGM
jgi:hypothetical protein